MIHAWPLKVQRPWPCLVLKVAERTQLKIFWLKSSKRLNAVQKNQDNGRYQKYPEEGRVKSSLEKPSVRWSIGNQWKSAVRPYITKSYFETYKLYDHMQKIRPIYPKIAITHSIFKVQGSSFGFSPLFIGSNNDVLQPWLYEWFLKFSIF